jgi:hypothetical protein
MIDKLESWRQRTELVLDLESCVLGEHKLYVVLEVIAGAAG